VSEISFFIPAYNCAGTISESVDSIMETNFQSGDELVIVNDCSTDNTAEVLSAIRQKYPVIKIITHTRNKGGGAARNTAIENSENELLFCLDSDNILEKDSIKKLKAYLIENNADVAAFQHLYYFSDSISKVNNIWSINEGIFSRQDLFSKSFSPGAGGNYLFTRKCWLKAGGYPEYAGALDTWGFGLNQLMTGAKMMILKDSYYYHRLIENSYYLRDAWSRRKSVSVRALQLIIPYLDYIDEKDIDYLFGKKGRYSWVENIEKRPIKVFDEQKKNGIWSNHDIPSRNWKHTVKKMLKINYAKKSN